MDLKGYNQSVESAVRRQDGISLRDHLRLSSPLATTAMEEYISQGGNLPAQMPEPWNLLPEIVERRFEAGAALNANDWNACCDSMASCLSAYLTVFSADSAWSIPLLHALCTDLRVVAVQADSQLVGEGRNPFKLGEVERVLKRGFVVTNNDRRSMEEGSRRAGILGVINQLLRVYFRLNNLRLCSNLTRTVNAKNFPPFEDFPAGDRVTYRFHSGRLHLCDDNVPAAIVDLTYAFQNLPRKEMAHKRHVLLYLIPAKVLMGFLPSENMLIKYKMTCYRDIVRGIKKGNMKLFDDAMEKYEDTFIKKALYLSVVRMKLLVYRSLCKRVSAMVGSNKVSIDGIRIGLQLCSKDMMEDEVECVVVNLIFKGYIKGYVSNKLKFLVLSKRDPFPPLQG